MLGHVIQVIAATIFGKIMKSAAQLLFDLLTNNLIVNAIISVNQTTYYECRPNQFCFDDDINTVTNFSPPTPNWYSLPTSTTAASFFEWHYLSRCMSLYFIRDFIEREQKIVGITTVECKTFLLKWMMTCGCFIKHDDVHIILRKYK